MTRRIIDAQEHFRELLAKMTPAQQLYVVAQRATGKRVDELLSALCEDEAPLPAEEQHRVLAGLGLDKRHADFIMRLARKVDAAAVERDKKAIADELTYRDFGRDLDKVMFRDLDRPFYRAASEVELPLYPSAEGFLEDCYFARGAFDVLARRASSWVYPLGRDLDRLMQALGEAGRKDLIVLVWVGIVRSSRRSFLSKRPSGHPSDADWLEHHKRHALDAYGDAIDQLEQAGEGATAALLASERDDLRDGVRPAIAPVSDDRSIDEPVFWEIIRQSRRADDDSIDDQLAALDSILRSFRGAEIRKFAAIYARLMRRTYHWNAWALAYAARDGCSEDSFMAFRTWLILQGDPALLEDVVNKPEKAAPAVPADPDLPDGTLMELIEEAYLARSGKVMEFPMIATDEPRGKEWDEDRFEETFPELTAHYDR